MKNKNGLISCMTIYDNSQTLEPSANDTATGASYMNHRISNEAKNAAVPYPPSPYLYGKTQPHGQVQSQGQGHGHGQGQGLNQGQGRTVSAVNPKGQGQGNAQVQVPLQPRVAYPPAANISARPSHTGENVQTHPYAPMQEGGQQYRMKPLEVEVVSSVRQSNPQLSRTSVPLRTIGTMSSDPNVNNNSGVRKGVQEKGGALNMSSPVRGRQPYSMVGRITSRSSTFKPPHSSSSSYAGVDGSDSSYQGDNQNNYNSNGYNINNNNNSSSSSSYAKKYSDDRNNTQLRGEQPNSKYRHPDADSLSATSTRGKDRGSVDSEVQILSTARKGPSSSSTSVGRKKRQVTLYVQCC